MPFQAKFKPVMGSFRGPMSYRSHEACGEARAKDANFVVRSEKYNLSLYFTPETKEHKCLKKLFSSFDMSEMKILHAPLHLPLLELKDQLVDLTLAVSKLQSEAKETKVEIEELKRRLLILEHRDQSPKRV
jgi:hypothetical protein